MLGKNAVLVIAAHPDDESLGMAGTIYNYTKKGNQVDVLFLSSGVGSRDVPRENAESRKEAATKALKLLGCEQVFFGDFPDNAFDSVGILNISKFIETYIDKFQPNIVYTNYYGDLNIDHRITAEATLVATRPKPQSSVNALYFYEVLSSTGWKFGSKSFNPNYYVDVTDSMPQKDAALRHYKNEMEPPPNARSFESIISLAKFRGSFIGFQFAEAFEVGFIRINNGIN
jgi:LmbE family N-acetylglucosaminyl deacetylase